MSPGRDARAVVAAAFDAINTGDRDAVVALAHPASTWAPTMWSGGRTFHGSEGLDRWLDQFGRGLEHLRIDVGEIREAGEVVLVLGTVHDTRDGFGFAAAIGWTFVVADGLLLDGRAHQSWSEARRAARLEGLDGA